MEESMKSVTIRKAQGRDSVEIHKLWKKNFGQLDHFSFKQMYEMENCWLCLSDGQLLATIQVVPHVMTLGSKRVVYEFISAHAAIEDENRDVYLKQMMDHALEIANHQCLISVISAKHADVYCKDGFEVIYRRKKHQFHRDDVKRYDTRRVSMEITDEQCLEIYQEFTRPFDGYRLRDEAWYKNYRERLSIEGGTIVGYTDEVGTMIGYMAFHQDSVGLIVDEIQYLNGQALASLLSFAASRRPFITVYTSERENLQVIVPNETTELIDDLMVRINDRELFEKCYGEIGTNVKETLAQFTKPMYLHEEK